MKAEFDIWKGGERPGGGGAMCAPRPSNDQGFVAFDPASFLSAVRTSLDDLASAAALLDEDGTILIANAAWQRRAPRGDHASLRQGDNYAQFEWELALQGDGAGIRLFDGLLEIISGISPRFEAVVSGSGAYCHRYYRAQFARIGNADAGYVCVVFHDADDARPTRMPQDQAASKDGRFLTEALATLVADFSRQTGLQIQPMLDDVSALRLSAETLLYDFVREGLSHFHHNVGAAAATLALTEADDFVHLVLWDDGNAFAEDEAGMNDVMASMGLVRIDELLREQGGKLTLHRVQHCTVLAASLPLGDSALS